MEAPTGKGLSGGAMSREEGAATGAPMGDLPEQRIGPEFREDLGRPGTGHTYADERRKIEGTPGIATKVVEVAAMGGRVATRIARTTLETGSRLTSSVSPEDARRLGMGIATAVPTVVIGARAMRAMARRHQAPPSFTDRIVGRIPKPFR